MSFFFPSARVARPLLLLTASMLTLAGADTVYTPPPTGQSISATAAIRDDWYIAVQDKFTRYGGKHADIVFDGDSITNRWEVAGKESWTDFADRAADFGIEGDRTENVLWRLSKGQVDGVDPKLVVLMIGTNNSKRDTPQQIADGVKAVVAEYEKRCPNAHIVLMAIFPRGRTAEDPLRKKVEATDNLIAVLGSDSRVSFIDIGPQLMEADGSISPEMMPDFLHPTAKGYVIWATALKPLVDKYAPKS